MKVLSLFDWIACWYEALQRAWIKIDKYYASEIDKYAIQIAEKNHPSIEEIWDVKDIFYEDWLLKKYMSESRKTNIWVIDNWPIDLLIWGSPCQWFSVAWKQLNFQDPRSALFFEYVRLLREVKPRYFLLENVKMKKEWQDIISRELWVEPIEINSALVSWQQRKRLYRTNIPWITQPTDKNIMLKDILESWISWSDKSVCITSRYWWAIFPHDYLRRQRQMVAEPIRIWQFWNWWQWERIYSVRWKSVSLSANWWGWWAKTWLYKIDLPDWDYIIRKLTPIECERLQTLPDNYTEWVSKTQRYKMIGNGRTVEVIKHIFSFLPKE